MTRRWIPAAAMVALVLAPQALRAQDSEWNRYTLENLDGVHIRFEVSEACPAGVDASEFEASTSLKLIEAEVGVLTREEMLENLALPELLVSLDCTDAPSGAVAYAVGLRVQQAAQMLRDTQITLSEAVTWYSTRIGAAPSGSVASAIGATLTEQLDVFAGAWRAANAEATGN